MRLSGIDGRPVATDELMIAGARHFLEKLSARGVRLFLASGTDQEYVRKRRVSWEFAICLRVKSTARGAISEVDSKELVIERILDGKSTGR